MAKDRRADIDYLRTGALMLLIVYHVLLVFSSDWWRVKSEHAGPWADYLISMLTPWRMALVFMIGGMAARFMIERSAPRAFVVDRAGKLLTAFAFAVIVLIPLQRYVRLDNDGAPPMSYLDFLLTRGRHDVQSFGIWLPDFANAWFLPYLFIYSAVAALIWRIAPSAFRWLERVSDAAPIWAIGLFWMGWFAFNDAAVLPDHPMSGLIFPDIGAHLRFAPIFLFGMVVGKSEPFRAKILGAKVWFWLLALLLLGVTLAMQWQVNSDPANAPIERMDWRIVRGFYAGAMLFGALGFAAWTLNKPSGLLTWASDAILPVYLMHQTVLVVLADMIVGERWPVGLEVSVLYAGTLLIPIAIYCMAVRRTPLLRVLFGLRPEARPWRTRSAPKPAATGQPAHRH